MISTITELREAIKSNKNISKEVTNTLLELDSLPSTTTQADLNNMLVELYNRLKNEEDITFEIFNEKVDTNKFIKWVETDFTTYSERLLKQTIHF